MWSGLPIQRRDQEHERAAYVHPDHNASGRLKNSSKLSFESSIDSMTASKGFVSGYLFDQALSHASTIRELAQRYADQVAGALGLPSGPLPDLGPAVVIDQLTVTVYDACRLAVTAGNGDEAATEMSDALAQLRQGIG